MLCRRVILLKRSMWVQYALCGAIAGLVNGFFGAGGGMVLVPALISIGKLEDKDAFSSAISMILPMCLATIAVYWDHGLISLKPALPYLAGGLLGGILGGILFRNVTAKFLHRIFGLVIVWGGIRLLWT